MFLQFGEFELFMAGWQFTKTPTIYTIITPYIHPKVPELFIGFIDAIN